ncbi:MAG: expansin EXLX1 family cellulose-binding protein [Cyanobacteria bacterium J06621_8]
MELIAKDLIQTEFIIKTEWDSGFTGRLNLTNKGDNLTDWTIQFESEFEIYADQIWGAEIVERSGNIYTLKPVDYNQSIDTNRGTSIFFNANKINGAIINPEEVQVLTANLITSQVENASPASINNQLQTEFVIKTEWDSGFTGRLNLTNKGDNLTDWTIQFESEFEIYDDQIWGAEIVSYSGNIYTLESVSYNQSIDTNQGTSIYFNANKINGAIIAPENVQLGNELVQEATPSDTAEEFPVTPENPASLPLPSAETEQDDLPVDNNSSLLPENPANVLINPAETKLDTTPENDLPVDVDFTLVNDWGSGFQGKISITNNTVSNIDTWTLDFDFSNQIDNIWNAAIAQNQNGNYSITNVRWNREISAGETLTFGFTGEDAVTIEPQNFELDGFTFDSPGISESIFTYDNPDLMAEFELDAVYQGRATFYDAANPSGGIGNSGFDVPAASELHKVVAINNIQWNGSEASGAFLEVAGPKQREGAAPIIVQIVDQLAERADGLDMSAEAFTRVADPVDGIANIEYRLVGPADDYVTAYGYSIGEGIVVEGIADSNPWYPTLRLNNHRYPIESVALIEADGDLVELDRGSDNRFVLDETAPIYGAQDLLVTDIFGQQVTLDDINISNGSNADTVTGEQFALI